MGEGILGIFSSLQGRVSADAGCLVRLRHPGVVHVVQALDENKNAMAMVTEPLFASVANALGNVENVTKAQGMGVQWRMKLRFGCISVELGDGNWIPNNVIDGN